MKTKWYSFLVMASLFLAVCSFPAPAAAQQPKPCVPDKALCAKMLRFGKEAYVRGKYLDAKEYFRKAIQADPTSAIAWKYYDQAVIFALAEKIEQNAGLLLPGVSKRSEIAPRAPASEAAGPPAPGPSTKGEEFEIVEDEGC